MNAAVSVIDAVNRLASIDVSIVRRLPLLLVHLKTSSLAASQAEIDIVNSRVYIAAEQAMANLEANSTPTFRQQIGMNLANSKSST
jgi:hypothetical protein